MFDEMNYRSTVREDVDTSSMEFIKLKDLIAKGVKEILVDGFFFTTGGKFGKSLVVVGCGYKINMPSHAVSKFETIASNGEMVNAVLNHGLKLTDFEEVDTGKGNPTIRFRMVDNI